jgi:hypothetical protein
MKCSIFILNWRSVVIGPSLVLHVFVSPYTSCDEIDSSCVEYVRAVSYVNWLDGWPITRLSVVMCACMSTATRTSTLIQVQKHNYEHWYLQKWQQQQQQDGQGNPTTTPPRAVIGDVRGSGLFLGIELVTSIETKAPATAEAKEVMGRLLFTHHILTSLDGRFDNVIVLKPPMCFSTANADTFVEALQECLTGTY